MKHQKMFKTLAFTLLGLLSLTGCNNGGNSSSSTGGTSTSDTETTSHIRSKLEAQYETGTPVDLAPDLDDGWTAKIRIQQEGITIVNELEGTTYTFTQIGNYTIIYTATNGTETETLSVNLTLVAPAGDTFLTFEGEKVNLTLDKGYGAVVTDKTTGETLLDTTYSYTRSASLGKTGYTNEENQVGPVIYVKYPDKTEENGLPAAARSVTIGDDGDMKIHLSFDETDDTVVCANADWKEVFNGEKQLTFNGSDSVFGPSTLDLYSDGMCSYSFLGEEVTAGRYNPETVYGGGVDGNHYGGGFWSFTGTTVEDFKMSLNIDGTDYEVTMDATKKLNFTYTYAISAYKRVMNMVAEPSKWEPALLGIAATKISFSGTKYDLICYDDDTQSAKVYNAGDDKTALAEGTWSFNSISRIFKLKFGDTEFEVPTDEDGRLYLDHVAGSPVADDYLESSLDWADMFDPQGTKIIASTGEISTIDGEDISITFFDNGTYLVKGTAESNTLVDTGSYTLINNVYTLTNEAGTEFTSTYADGVFSLTYTLDSYSIAFAIQPALVMSASTTFTSGDTEMTYTYYLYAYAETGYDTACFFQIYGFQAGVDQVRHSDSGSYTLANDVYTFTSAKNGEFSSTGTGDDRTVSYTYQNAGADVTLTFSMLK